MTAAVNASASDLVSAYLSHGFRIITWPAVGDIKGPRELEWPSKIYTTYPRGSRVGLLTGVEVAPGRFLNEADIDWAPGAVIALKLLPKTPFVFGRTSKKISHAFYTTPDALPSFKYEDPVDKTTLIELRGVKHDGSLGFQTMVPPSVWSKQEQSEPLLFTPDNSLVYRDPAHLDKSSTLNQAVCLSAIGMLLGKHFGRHGFGHDTRLAWAGFLLRVGIDVESIVAMGEGLSAYCENRETADVRLVVQATADRMRDTQQKIKGGPALARLLGEGGKRILECINGWLGKDSDFIRNEKGVIIPRSQENIRRALVLLDQELSCNQFSAKLLLNGQPLEQKSLRNLYLQIETEHRFSPPLEYFEMVVENIAWTNKFHPVVDYLNALVWDQVPRIDTWLIQAASADDSEYVRAVSSILLVAAVRRVKQPGCKYDEMMVWESNQGGDKSSAVQALCPNPEWFSDDLALNLRSQQLIEATLGKWIIEASDLAGKRKTEIEQLKAMLSRQVDGPARMAYEHFPVERPRHFVIIGTTNSASYLTDPTGARRFWPVAVGLFNLTWIRANRDQLWAEAVHREAAGESIRLPKALWPIAGEHQESRREVDPWEDLIVSLLDSVKPGVDGRIRVATKHLWEALGIEPQRRERIGALRISDVMHRLKYQRTRVQVTGEGVQVGYIQEKQPGQLHLEGETREKIGYEG